MTHDTDGSIERPAGFPSSATDPGGGTGDGGAHRPKARPDVVFRPMEDEWVLFDPVAHRIHVLNLTAALVWSLCDGVHDLEEMAREVAGSFSGAPEPSAVAEEVTATVERFREEGLLE